VCSSDLVNPLTGQEVPVGTPGSVVECRSVLAGTDINCVPYDIFSGNGPSAASINYLNVFGVITGQTSEQVADANVTGALGEMGIQSPWSDEGVGVNFGTEYRKESLSLNPDQEFQTGDLTGQGAPTLPVNGAFRVLEVFGEAQIPIVRHAFIDDLSIAAGYRKSWYKTEPERTCSIRTAIRSSAAPTAPTPTNFRRNSLRSATSGSAPRTTARSVHRTSRSCSPRSSLASTARPTIAPVT